MQERYLEVTFRQGRPLAGISLSGDTPNTCNGNLDFCLLRKLSSTWRFPSLALWGGGLGKALCRNA